MVIRENKPVKYSKITGEIMKNLILVFISAILFMQLISCKNNPVEPGANYPAGSRDYTWTIDILNSGYESISLGRIWGSSSTDVWAVGSSSSVTTTIWHFNGNQWRCDSVGRNVQPSAVFGFSSNEVWLGSSNSTIWKYNGSNWQKYGDYKVSGFTRLDINNFDGTSSNNIYGVGFVDINSYGIAVIMHYNGFGWSFINIPSVILLGLETVAIEPSSGVLVMSGTVYDPAGFIAKIYCLEGNDWKELLSGSGWSFVTKLGNEIFATLASKIYLYSNKQLVLWKDNSGRGINGNIICGRSRNDFFIGGVNGIVHYNGTDFTTIYNTQLTVERGTVIGNDVFFIGIDYTNMKNYMIHGKLK